MSEPLCSLCRRPLKTASWRICERRYHEGCKQKVEEQYIKDVKSLKQIMWPNAEAEVRRKDEQRT